MNNPTSPEAVAQNIRGYEIQELIEKGGFGAVYRAYQPQVSREVAIKLIRPEHANQPRFIRSFEAEAKMVARLEHPFIVPLFDYWRDPQGAYLVMRYLRGGNLKQEMKQGPIALERIAQLLDQICRALWLAHRNHVIHRDIKPANVLLDEQGNAYLTDFGIAMEEGNDQFEKFVGTWLYLPPERVHNGEQTPAMDVYSLGIMLFQMLTGEYPFPKTPLDHLPQHHVNTPVPDIETIKPNLPHALNIVVQRATAKDPTLRYEDIRQLADQFREIITETGITVEVDDLTPIENAFLNPYKGLRPFSEADEELFFGRTALTQRLLERLDEKDELSHFLALVGPSGSGKSSVVYAGLLPALRRHAIEGSDSWYVATMVPGNQPFVNLAESLRSIASIERDDLEDTLQANSQSLLDNFPKLVPAGEEDPTLLLFIDQFEELFTLVEDEAEQDAFMSLLYATVTNPKSNIWVIVTIRADFYDKPLQYEEFGLLMQARTEVILPLTSSELEQAITGPAKRVGITVEPNLIAEIIADVRSEPGALPLLQYTLTELFERKEGMSLTLDAYNESGGVQGALARRAELVYQALSDEEQRIAKQIFLRLVSLGEGNEDTRRRAKLSDFSAIQLGKSSLQSVLDAFGRYRLLTFDNDPETREPTVEVAHEALIREWIRFRTWLDGSRNDIRLQNMLASEVEEWQANGEDTSYLLHGARLAQFEEWATDTNIMMSSKEYDFIQASVREREKLEQQEAERQANELQLERQSRRRLQAVVGVLLVASVIGGFLTVGIFNQSQTAQAERENAVRARDEALRREIEAESLTLATTAQQAYGDGDVGLALAFALAATTVENAPEITRNTLSTIAYDAGIQQVLVYDGSEQPVNLVTVSSDNRYVLASMSEQFIGSGALTGAGPPPPGGPPPRGGPPAGGPPPPPQGGPPPNNPQNVANPVNQLPTTPPVILLWDLETGEVLHEFHEHEGYITSVILLPTEKNEPPRQAVSASSDGRIILWNVMTGEIIREFENEFIGYLRLSTSADGKKLLVSDGEDQFRLSSLGHLLWDVESGEILQRVPAHEEGLFETMMHPDGDVAISMYENGMQLVWDVETGKEIGRFQIPIEGLRRTAYSMALSADGRTAITNIGQDTLVAWDIETLSVITQLPSASPSPMRVAFDGEGKQAVIITNEGVLSTWDIDNVLLLGDLADREQDYQSVAFNYEGGLVVAGTRQGLIQVWDLVTTHPDLVSGLHEHNIERSATFLPSSTESPLVLTFGADVVVQGEALQPELVLWDGNTGELIDKWATPHIYMPEIVITSDDGRYALTGANNRGPGNPPGGSPNIIVLWDIENRSVIREIDVGDSPIFTLQFVPVQTPNSSPTQAISNFGRGVTLWDLETGEAIRQFETNETPVVKALVSSDNQWLFATGRDGLLYQWDFESGELIQTIELGSLSYILLLTSDEQQVITANQETNIVIWDINTGERIATLSGHTDRVTTATLLKKDNVLITGADDFNILWWDLDTNTNIQPLIWHISPVIDIVASPNEEYFVSVGLGDQFYVWDTEPATLEEMQAWITENRVVPELSVQDCSGFQIEEICENIILE